MVAKLSLFFGRFAKMFDSRDRFVVYVVVVFLMKNCCVSSRGKSILTKKKRAFDADNFPQHPTILEKRLKWKNDDKALTFVLSAIDVTGFPRLSTRSCPCTIAFTSVLIVFLIVFAFCNMMMMNESRDERQIVFFFQSSFNLLLRTPPPPPQKTRLVVVVVPLSVVGRCFCPLLLSLHGSFGLGSSSFSIPLNSAELTLVFPSSTRPLCLSLFFS